MTAHKLEDLAVGQQAERTVTVDDEFVARFAAHTGDTNPLHLDAEFAATTDFKRRVAHGLSYGAVFSQLIGTELPGEGALWISQEFRFLKPVYIGDVVTLSVTVASISRAARTVTLDCAARNQYGEDVLSGKGDVKLLERAEAQVAAGPYEEQRIALVTGGSRGIGAAVARRLDRDGFSVAVTYRSSHDEARMLASELANGHAIKADASIPADGVAAVAETAARFGRTPDTLVFCACDPMLSGTVDDETFERFDRHWRSQVEGTYSVVKACLPEMRKRRFGNIVAIGTVATENRPPPKMTPYIVAKAALTSYVRCLAVELGPDGIRANVVAPGLTETALVHAVSERQRKVMVRDTPLRRLGQPDDMAGVVAFLVSPDAAHVSGETVLVSGGSVIR